MFANLEVNKDNKKIQRILIEAVKSELNGVNLTDDELYDLLFINMKNTGRSLRLQRRGFEMCKDLFEYSMIELHTNMPLSTIAVHLNKICYAPYYIFAIKGVAMFDQKEAIMMKLVGGDFSKYLNLKGDARQ